MRLPCALTLVMTLACGTLQAQAAEQRCGWIQNPTPSNWWLVDKQATWIMMTQGGSEPAGFDHVPDISTKDYVRQNGNYGYACACLNGDFDKASSKMTRLYAFRQLPLKTCRNDRSLPKP